MAARTLLIGDQQFCTLPDAGQFLFLFTENHRRYLSAPHALYEYVVCTYLEGRAEVCACYTY